MDEQLKKALRIPEDIEVSFDAVDWQRVNQSAYPKDMRRLREMYMQVYAGNKYLMTAKFHQNKEIEKEVYTYLLTSAVFGYQTAPVSSGSSLHSWSSPHDRIPAPQNTTRPVIFL